MLTVVFPKYFSSTSKFFVFPNCAKLKNPKAMCVSQSGKKFNLLTRAEKNRQINYYLVISLFGKSGTFTKLMPKMRESRFP